MNEPTPTSTVIGYIRVSTTMQVEDGISLDAQEAAVRRYCDQKGFTLARLFVERGVSAGKALHKRPEGGKLVELLKTHQVDGIVATKLDRLFRNMQDASQRASEWKERGIHLHLAQQAIDTSTVTGGFTMHLFAAIAEMERNQIKERVGQVSEFKRSKGERMGGPPPYGYRRRLGGQKIEPDPDEQARIEFIHGAHRDGLSFTAIANLLNEEGIPARGKKWHHHTISRILRRPEDYDGLMKLTSGRNASVERNRQLLQKLTPEDS